MALSILSITHIMPVIVLNACVDANMQLTINSFTELFPDKIFSLTFPWFLVKSLTFPWRLSVPWHFQVFQRSGLAEDFWKLFSEFSWNFLKGVFRDKQQSISVLHMIGSRSRNLFSFLKMLQRFHIHVCSVITTVGNPATAGHVLLWGKPLGEVPIWETTDVSMFGQR